MKVIPLRGAAVPGAAPNVEVVERLEMLLERARAGEIAGLAYGYAEPPGDVGTGWVGGNRMRLAAAVELMHYRFFRWLDDDP